MYTAQDWENYLIVSKIKDDPILTKVKSSDVKPNMIELDRKIVHNIVMSIHEFFIDRDEPAHLVDQVVHDMEWIGDRNSEGANRMGQFFAAALSVDVFATLWVLVYMPFSYG